MTCLSPPILTGHFCRHFPCNHEYNILQFRLINHIKIITNQATMRLFNILQNLDNADSGTKKLGSEIPIISRKPSLKEQILSF